MLLHPLGVLEVPCTFFDIYGSVDLPCSRSSEGNAVRCDGFGIARLCFVVPPGLEVSSGAQAEHAFRFGGEEDAAPVAAANATALPGASLVGPDERPADRPLELVLSLRYLSGPSGVARRKPQCSANHRVRLAPARNLCVTEADQGFSLRVTRSNMFSPKQVHRVITCQLIHRVVASQPVRQHGESIAHGPGAIDCVVQRRQERTGAIESVGQRRHHSECSVPSCRTQLPFHAVTLAW